MQSKYILKLKAIYVTTLACIKANTWQQTPCRTEPRDFKESDNTKHPQIQKM
jgi:hypothetical protein